MEAAGAHRTLRPMSAPEPALAVLGEPGWGLLLDAGIAWEDAGDDALRAADLLVRRRPGAPPAGRAAALELVGEGARLARKVGAEGRLLAVRDAVEQATSGRVAAWHAERLDPACRVLEIGCGCGGDSLAIARRVRNLLASEQDAVRAACAAMNLAALGLANARVVPGDGLGLLDGEGSAADAVFADPDRRPSGRRTLDPEAWRPPLSRLATLAAGPRSRRVFVKAAPSLDPGETPDVFDVAYVSHGGECVEAFLESRTGEAGPRRVRAVLLPDDGPAVELEGDRGDAPWLAPGERPGEAVLVPDPAAIRARLLAELCARHGLRLAGEGLAWLTGRADVRSPWLRAHPVTSVVPLAHAAAELRRLGAGAVRVRVRGLRAKAPDLEAAWRRALVPGGPPADAFAARWGGRPSVVVCLAPSGETRSSP